ncbi:hypothetical protein Tco_1262485 [Tanacetum coccineum]
MVNTRTDAELAAAVQAAVDAMLPQIREQVREEYRAGASGGNPPPATIHTWLERFNKQKPHSFEKAVAPAVVAEAARKLGNLRDRDDYDRSERFRQEAQEWRPVNSPLQSQGILVADADQRNIGHQSHRSTTSGKII